MRAGGPESLEAYKKMVECPLESPKDIARLFPKTAEQIRRFADFAIQNARQELDSILAIEPEKRTFDNTVYALDASQSKLSRIHAIIEVLSMVSPEKDIRDAAHEKEVAMSKLLVDLYTEPKLYQAFKDYQDINMKSAGLTGQERYFFEQSMKDFKRSGLHLPKDKLQEIKNINKEIAQISSDFMMNISTDKSTLRVTRDELAGVDEHVIKNLKRDGEKYIVGCDYPTYLEVMRNCTVGKTRKALYLLFQNRAYPKNMGLLKKLIAKNDALGKKLGFKSYAALDFDAAMAQNTKTVETFLYELIHKTEKKVDQEFELFKKNLPAGIMLDSDNRLNPWDYGYIVSEYKKKHFNIDEREIAKYFPVQRTLESIFKIYQDFLGLDFRFVKPDWAWHEDVQLIEITDRATKKLYGYLFLDLYPRDNKYSHACHWTLVSPQEDSKRDISTPDICIVIANFPKATKDRPALLKYDNVKTFFHEFGHAMHGVMGRTVFATQSGTAVKRDFVEVPSQMFEEWMSNKDMLARVSGHYQTGKPLPEELLDKKIALKKLTSGYFVQGQCFLALASLLYFMPGAQKDTDAIWRDLHRRFIRHTRFIPETHPQMSFVHLVHYGAKYYGYMWAKVFALDIFYELKKHGLENEKMAQKFVDCILSKGGSDDPNKLLRDFLGREPNQEAFLKDLGLV